MVDLCLIITIAYISQHHMINEPLGDPTGRSCDATECKLCN